MTNITILKHTCTLFSVCLWNVWSVPERYATTFWGQDICLQATAQTQGQRMLDIQGICLLQVPEDIFICASTGRCYPISQSPYLGVESMWNHNNYWVCMQMPEPHSDSRAIPKQLSLDFTDASKWEYVLPNAAPQVHLLLGSCNSCCCCCCCCCCSSGMTVRTAVLVQKLE